MSTGFYDSRMCGVLRDYVKYHTSLPREEQSELYQELAIMRHMTGQIVELYSQAIEGNKPEAMVSSAMVLKDFMKDVVAIVDKIARIEATQRDKVPLELIEAIVAKVSSIAERILPEEMVVKLVLALDRQVAPGWGQGQIIEDDNIIDVESLSVQAKRDILKHLEGGNGELV